MRDLREQAIKAAEKVTDVIDDLDLWHELVAESILAVAEPIIRADERERLAKKAYEKAMHVAHYESDSGTDWFDVPDWLRAQHERENTR